MPLGDSQAGGQNHRETGEGRLERRDRGMEERKEERGRVRVGLWRQLKMPKRATRVHTLERGP